MQYKVDNQEAIRPLYLIGLIMSGVVFLYSLLSRRLYGVIKRLLLTENIIFLYLLLLYILCSSLISGMRETKDALYLIFWILFIPSIIITLSLSKKKSSMIDIFHFLSPSIVLLCLFSCVTAFLTFFGFLSLEIGEYKLIQNYWTAFRIHGFMGQPTALGSFIGFSLILLSYSDKPKIIFSKNIIYAILIFSLIATGSRNSIVSLIAVLIFNSLINLKLGRVLFYTISIIFCAFILFISIENFKFAEIILSRGDTGDSKNNRLLIWANVIDLLSNKNILEILIGNGAGSLSKAYRAAFNVPLHILYDYGIIGFVFYMMTFLFSMIRGIVLHLRTKKVIYKIGLNILLYGFIFNLFISSFISPFFSFHVLSFVLGIIIINTKPNNLMGDKFTTVPTIKLSPLS